MNRAIPYADYTPGSAPLVKYTGPLLNPALAFGQMFLSFEFGFFIQYLLVPFGGAALALVFYELIFVRSQEYLNADDDTDHEGQSLQDGVDASPPKGKKLIHNIDVDDNKSSDEDRE